MSDRAMLAGAGVVGYGKVQGFRRKRVTANKGYGDNAPYFETLRDAAALERRYAGKAPTRRVERGKVHKQTNRDIALMARMGTIHNPNE